MEIFRKALNHAAKRIQDYRPLWTPRRLYTPLKSIPVDRPIFVLGTQGAGLTLLTRMIRRHPRTATIGGGPEFWAGNDEMDKHYVAHEQLPDALSLRSPGYGNMTGRERDHPRFGYGRSWVYATDELLSNYRLTREDRTPQLEEALIQRIRWAIRAYARRPERARFVDMSQSYSLKVPFLTSALSDVRFVLLLRNPFAMCWREVTRRRNKYRFWNRVPSRAEAVRLAAEHWSNSYRIALSDLEGEDRGIVLKFEDFVRRPEKWLRNVLEHVELDYRSELLPQPDHVFPLGSKSRSKWYPIRECVNDRYLSEIPDRAVEIVADRCGDLADRFGYVYPAS